MSVETRLMSVVEEALEPLRQGFRDVVGRAIETAPVAHHVLSELAKRAYELGYREALAAQGQAASTTTSNLAASSTSGELDWVDDEDLEPEGGGGAGPSPATAQVQQPEEQVVDWSSLEEEGPEVAAQAADDSRRTPTLRIFPHASVGTLRQRILDVFELSRFDVDVIICRKGDRARRQLKGTVKLSKYLVGE